MEIIEIGKPFPKYVLGAYREGMAFLNCKDDPGLHIGFLMDNISEKEKNMFDVGDLVLSLYNEEGVTIMVSRWQHNFSFDTLLPYSLDISLERSNRVCFYLIELSTGILYGARIMGVTNEFLDSIKIGIYDHNIYFDSREKMSLKGKEVFNRLSTEDIFNRSQLRYEVGRR